MPIDEEEMREFHERIKLANRQRADDFAREFIETMPPEEKATFVGKPKPHPILHHFGYGMEVRNRLKLWKRVGPLSCADDLSGHIIGRAWEILNGVNPDPVE